jgi:23S rRNA pseudouridine1911/1915/1917 synthase
MLPERILYEDDDFLAFNKLPGELAQGDRQGDASLIELLAGGKKYTFLQPVHRLDRPASGAIVFAKTMSFFTALTELFRTRAVEKTYWAVVERRPPAAADELRHRLAPDRRKNVVSVREGGDGPEAVLSYRLICSSDRYFFLVVRPSTGRQHQIRAQLGAAGMPIKGDAKYGARRANPDRSILLHARSLAFAHPFTRRDVLIEARPPRGVLWDLFVQAATAAGGEG